MTRGYWIQLSARRLERHTVYHADIYQGPVLVASTARSWPENGGCGKAAAIREASETVLALEYQDWQNAPLSVNSLKFLETDPFTHRWMLWLFTAWFITIAIVGACR